jgi:hypothetical protein
VLAVTNSGTGQYCGSSINNVSMKKGRRVYLNLHFLRIPCALYWLIFNSAAEMATYPKK